METRLPLAPGEPDPRSPTSVSYPWTQRLGKLVHRAIRQASRDLASEASGRANATFLPDRAVEQKRLLEHHAQLGAIGAELDGARSTPSTPPSLSSAHGTPQTSPMIVDFPAPEGPTSAVTVRERRGRTLVEHLLASLIGEAHPVERHVRRESVEIATVRRGFRLLGRSPEHLASSAKLHRKRLGQLWCRYSRTWKIGATRKRQECRERHKPSRVNAPAKISRAPTYITTAPRPHEQVPDRLMPAMTVNDWSTLVQQRCTPPRRPQPPALPRDTLDTHRTPLRDSIQRPVTPQ